MSQQQDGRTHYVETDEILIKELAADMDVTPDELLRYAQESVGVPVKAQYSLTDDDYREAARRLPADASRYHVAPRAHVQRVRDDGAFVEMTIWVPAREGVKRDERA